MDSKTFQDQQRGEVSSEDNGCDQLDEALLYNAAVSKFNGLPSAIVDNVPKETQLSHRTELEAEGVHWTNVLLRGHRIDSGGFATSN